MAANVQKKKHRMKIKKNDIVKVIAGKEVTKQGKVLRVFHKSGRIIVEKINFIHRHTKPSSRNRQGGIIEKEGSINSSNVMVVCPSCRKATRIRMKWLSEDRREKVRSCAHCAEVLDK